MPNLTAPGAQLATVQVPVIDIKMVDVPVPAVPPLPQLPPPPSLEDLLSALDMALPAMPAPDPTQLYAGVPPMPPLDFTQLLSPLGAALDLLGSGVLEDIEALAAEEENGGMTTDARPLSGGMAPAQAAAMPTAARSAAPVPGGHPLSKLASLDSSLLSTIEQGQRALDALERAWQSLAATTSIAKGRELESSKRELRDQGTKISALTKEGAAIIGTGKAQLQLVVTRLAAQLAALAPAAFTPWGQAAILSAIATATAEAQAIIASTEAQLAPVTQQMLAAARPVHVPAPPVPMAQVSQAFNRMAGAGKSAVAAASPSRMYSAASAAAPMRSLEELGRRNPMSALTGPAALTGPKSQRTKAIISLAKKAFAAFQKSAAHKEALPVAAPSHTAPSPVKSAPSSKVPTSSPRASGAGLTGSAASVGAAGPAAGGTGGGAAETALPTYTAAATPMAASAASPGGAAAAAGAAAGPRGMGGAPGMMPMAPMAPMGAAGAAAGAGAGGDSVKSPRYLVSAANGAEIFGEQLDVSPAVIGGLPNPDPATAARRGEGPLFGDGGSESPDSTRLNL